MSALNQDIAGNHDPAPRSEKIFGPTVIGDNGPASGVSKEGFPLTTQRGRTIRALKALE